MSGVLIDTSLWVDHLRRRNLELAEMLRSDMVLSHPMVIGEIACGTPPVPRSRTLDDFRLLPRVREASLAETMALIESESIYGMDVGLIDFMLLTSTLITPGARLWSLDMRLVTLAARFGVAYQAADQ